MRSKEQTPRPHPRLEETKPDVGHAHGKVAFQIPHVFRLVYGRKKEERKGAPFRASARSVRERSRWRPIVFGENGPKVPTFPQPPGPPFGTSHSLLGHLIFWTPLESRLISKTWGLLPPHLNICQIIENGRGVATMCFRLLSHRPAAHLISKYSTTKSPASTQ